MEAVFLKILNMGITATWVALGVIAIRFLLKKAPKWISVALWVIVGLRLVCPFSLESIFSLVPSTQTVPPEIMLDATPEVTTGINSLNNVLNPIISSAFAPNPGTSANPLQILIPVASIIWIVGMVAMFIYALISYWRLRRKVRESVYLKGPFQICDHVDTPFILGIFHPRVYLPSNMNETDMPYVMAHENAHLRRYDHWWKPIGYLLLTVYWFHPVLWLAYILLCRDIEMACDEKVIQEMGPGSKKPYSEALLNCSVPRRIIAACPLAFGEVSIKTRIKSVLHYKQPAFWLIVLAVVLCLIFAVCFLTDPVQTVPDLIQPNTFWQSTDTDSYFSVSEDFSIEGVLSANGMTHQVCIMFRPRYAEIYKGSPEDVHSGTNQEPIIKAGLRARNGKLIFLLREDFLHLGTEKLIFENISNSAESDSSFLSSIFNKVNLNELNYDEINIPGILSNVREMTVTYEGTSVPCLERASINRFIATLAKIEVHQKPISLNRSEDRSKVFTIQINGNTELHFNKSFTEVWVDNHVKPSLTHRITNPSIAQELILDYNFTVSDFNSDNTSPSSESSLDTAITAAILAQNKSSKPDGLLNTESHIILATETVSGTPIAESTEHITETTVYMLYMHLRFSFFGGQPKEVSGSFVPAAITFTHTKTGEYQLKSYWEPRDGAYYADDIQARFPAVAADRVLIHHQNYVDELEERCWEAAREYLRTLSENQDSEKPVLGSAMAWAGADEAAKLYEGAVNYKATLASIERHLPLYKFDTKADLQQFISTFEDHCDLDSGYSDAPSFRELTASFNDAFFAGNTVFLVYVGTDSTSHHYQITDYAFTSNPYTGTTFTLQVQETPGTDPIDPTRGSWFVLTAVPDTMLKDCAEFDAILQ